MSMPLIIHPLQEEQQEALKIFTRRAVGRVAERARMILLSAEGKTAIVICVLDTPVAKLPRFSTAQSAKSNGGLSATKPKPWKVYTTSLAKDAQAK
ncbi:hypothetical protein H8E77_14465 [bacterium]|nr:hypothetical protein [bacterium]